MNEAREEILGKIRTGLGRSAYSPVAPIPPSARMAPRLPGDLGDEIDLLLAEVAKLSGVTRRLAHRDELPAALAEMIETQRIKRATIWAAPELQEIGLASALETLGVEVISPREDPKRLAECDLGITGVDAALPETGTLVLRSSPEHSRLVSLVPRVHLAIVRPSDLRADLHQVFADVKGSGQFVFITGPSRSADIELSLTIGVHGPKALYVWVLPEVPAHRSWVTLLTPLGNGAG